MVSEFEADPEVRKAVDEAKRALKDLRGKQDSLVRKAIKEEYYHALDRAARRATTLEAEEARENLRKSTTPRIYNN